MPIDPLNVALDYIAKGWALLPLRGGSDPTESKHPRFQWERLARKASTADEVRRWFDRWPETNIGVVLCASQAPSGKQLVCIDTDSAEAETWVCSQQPLPPTPMVQTAKGLHRYFWAPADREHFAGNGRELPEVRAGVHYCALPPSQHYTGVAYEWCEFFTLADVAIADLPPWGVALMPMRVATPETRTVEKSADVVREGGRNNALIRKAGQFRRAGLEEQALRLALAEWNQAHCEPPVDAKELDGIVQSVMRYPPGETAQEAAAREQRRTERETEWETLLASAADLSPDAPAQPTDCETATIGAMIARPEARAWCLQNLTTDDFHQPDTKAAFSVVADLDARSEAVDVALVTARLAGQHVQVAACLPAWVATAPMADAVKSHAAQLRVTATSRGLANMADAVREKLKRAPNEGYELLSFVQDEVRRLGEKTNLDNRSNYVAEYATDYLNKLDETRSGAGAMHGLRSGIEEFDNHFWGLSTQRLVIVKGQSGFGKTTFVDQCIFATAMEYMETWNKVLLVYMLEDTKESFFNRFLQWRALVPDSVLRRGGARCTNAAQAERLSNAVSDLPRLPVLIDDRLRRIETIESDVRNCAMQWGVAGVLIDYAQEVKGGDGDNRVGRLEDIAMRLATLAGEIEAPILLPSQVTLTPDGRHAEKHATGLRDAASLVIEIERGEPGQKLHEKQESDKVSLLCDKARNDPPFGLMTCHADWKVRRLYGENAWERRQNGCAEVAAPSQSRDESEDEDPWHSN